MRKVAFSIAAVLLSVQVSLARTPQTDRISRIEQSLLPPVLVEGDGTWTLDERMRHYRVPAVSVAVIQNGRLVWARAWGTADVESGRAASPATLFQAASISKPATAMAAMNLVEEGAINLDDDVNRWLASWRLPESGEAANRVTLRQLLSHSAGVTVRGFAGYAPSEPIPSLQQILNGEGPANSAAVRVAWRPDSEFRYSGGGSSIVQLLLTDVTGKSFRDVMHAQLFRPLRMKESSFAQPPGDEEIEHAARAYRSDGSPVEGGWRVYPELAAAGMWSTPSDLAKLIIEMQHAVQGRGRLLRRNSALMMLRPRMQNEEGVIGLGWFLEQHGGELYFTHGGSNAGYRALLIGSVSTGDGAVVMTNSDNGFELSREIVRAIAREYRWKGYLPSPYPLAAVDAATLDRYAGRYQVDRDMVVSVFRNGSTLKLQDADGTVVVLHPRDERTFVRTDVEREYRFDGSELEIVEAKRRWVAGRATEEKTAAELMLAGNVSGAVEWYREQYRRDASDRIVAPARLNALAYAHLQNGKRDVALQLFRLNAELHPKSASAIDSLADMLLLSGDRAGAASEYRTLIEVLPQDESLDEEMRTVLFHNAKSTLAKLNSF